MKAYHKILLQNTFLVTEAKSLRNGKFITADQFLNIKNKMGQLKSQSNFLVRIGFFLLGVLLFSSMIGALSLFMLSVFDSEYFEGVIYFYALIGIGGSEFLSRNNYFNHGLDDAFILGFQLVFFTAVGISSESKIQVLIAMAIVGLFCCLRYIHTISAIISLVGITGALSVLIIDYNLMATVFLPFVLLALAFAMYWIFTVLDKKEQAYFYQFPLQALQVFSLLLGYASVNYFVVREMSAELIGVTVTPGSDIPFAILFYILTFLIPVGFIFFGLKNKSRELLLVGLLCFALSIFTIRYYYSLMPIELALILCGLMLFGIAYFGIAKLKHKESGITFIADRNNDKNSLLYAQAIIVNSQLQMQHSQPEDPMSFGGGGFSGGGAGETF